MNLFLHAGKKQIAHLFISYKLEKLSHIKCQGFT